ncbi:MAG: tRNA preQ1(34) S-adenosylmethionine ribosyltransferase-isomerase QueA [Dehalococcoidia bacterium]|nr:tRNA preQ1(34) S-adenosylmethionine ribosyltransferase-isomerase QueA [Dehalococcoidia bacterium]
MLTSDFDYPLPHELIAQTPAEPRDHSRLLVLDRAGGAIRHRGHFYEVADELRPGDLLVLNDTRVLPARLYGVIAATNGKVELLLLRRTGPGRWLCLGRPGRRLTPGARLLITRNGLSLEAEVEAVDQDGLRAVRFADEALLDRVGVAPLPPYIHAPLADPERYQTVYARSPGSAAAPTAGLHFTPELLQHLRGQGVQTATVTLHVGLDTFKPVDEEDPAQHRIHTEYWELGAGTADALNHARAEGRRVVAVGTTSVRVLEQAASLAEQHPGAGQPWRFTAASGWADLFILPGYRFRAVDALITNFHLPRSTLLMLVSAFAGRQLVLRAYQEAIAHRYRFYSFGDCMVIL